ncbi:RNA-binding protein [Trypanosoma grayi]|uniref:RNA-binding protein n=1 Tax=Trypanosoma grayi TaxID=71804 RepID=UPI0004F40D9C|nr:RNA-binding protein [Trypanosoma grayi]KEG07349.1 RNA-binding protein [Trypanosoma grayi]
MSFQNLFVAKLPRNLNDADLEQIFAEYKPISAKVMLDASTGKSKGFGFVLFNTEEEGRRAYDAMNRRHVVSHGHHFNLCVFPSQHSGKAAFSVSNALYIRNIPITVPQEQVEQFLASFGTLTYCATREDHYGNPVWVVYAEYDCLECSKNVLQKLHGNSEHFRGPPVMVKYADSEEAKRERRRRREEGKLARAPAPRSACVFPPPRNAAGIPEFHHSNSLDAGTVVSSNSSTNGGACPRGNAQSRDSISGSVGPNLSSDSSSRASSAYKVMDVFNSPPPQLIEAVQQPQQMFFPPPLYQLPPMYPADFCNPPAPPSAPAVHPKCGSEKSQPAVLVLENGQQLLLASNAVNVRPSEMTPVQGNTFFWAPVDTLYTPPPPPSYAYVPVP